MASHRKPRASRTLQTLHAHSPAVGVTTAAALASVTLLSSQSATAAPGASGDPERKPTVEEVQRKVDDLYRQAGTATQQYGRAKESAEPQQRRGAGGAPAAARRTEAPDAPRRAFGSLTGVPHRSGGQAPAASLLRAEGPPVFADPAPPAGRPVGLPPEAPTELLPRQTGPEPVAAAVPAALADPLPEPLTAPAAVLLPEPEPAPEPATRLDTWAAEPVRQRAEAAPGPESLSASQASLRATKRAVQHKLVEARALLIRLTAGKRAEAEEARTLHEPLQTQPQPQPHLYQDPHQPLPPEAHLPQHEPQQPSPSPSSYLSQQQPQQQQPDDDGGPGAKAREVLAFAEAQTGKPYVWGATGPSSYDCSGLTQAAWRAAGVDLPRTTLEQAGAGTPVAIEDLRPGDLVFFHADISHVGIYKGDGRMIHAPRPGEVVREESIHHLPVHSSVRPA
ncbi:C40 family peptidase [Streptomyces lavendulocolor]|uniref:C40 family peptidase n=1 Tax=Streptomyces lavendulocolor TaxID=67316 RepID=UPI0033777FBC